MNYEEEIAFILKDNSKYLLSWVELAPKVYYKDCIPYGLIGCIHSSNGVIYVASTTSKSSLPFTIGMIRDIISLNKTSKICLLTDDINYQAQIRSVLTKFGGFRFEDKNGVLFSYNYKE